MLDQYDRTIDYIRISITDLCNLRCVYCMPSEGVKKLCHKDILSYEEILLLCKQFAKLGIRKIKITGGEPLVRKGVAYFIQQLYMIEGIEEVTLTTNGVLLAEQAEALYQAGIRHINVSLDTIDPDIFKQITRYACVHDVVLGIQKALHLGIHIKMNVLPVQGLNDTKLMDMVSFAKDEKIAVRFIELMPIGIGRVMQGVSEDEIKQQIEQTYGALTPIHSSLGNGPGVYYTFPGCKGAIGFISALSHTFCKSCNRIRLSADGFLKPCLQYDTGLYMRPYLDKDEDEIRQHIASVIYTKPKAHAFLEAAEEHKEQQLMSKIGG